MRSLTISTPHQYYSVDQIENNETGGARSTYGGEKGRIQGFDGEIWGKMTTW
jgi:hypothetical protein